MSHLYKNLPPNVYKTQLHAHTTNSDGIKTPAQVVAEYEALGFDALNISDHDVWTPDPGNGTTMLVITGVEESVSDLDNPNSHTIVANTSAAIASTITADVIAGAPYTHFAHPELASYTITAAEVKEYGIPIEINAYGAVDNTEPFWDSILSDGYEIYGVMVDDSHAGIGNRGWVMVYADSLDTDEIIQGLILGRYYSTFGPILTLVDDHVTFSVTATEACNFEFIGTGGAVYQTDNNTTSAEYTYDGDEVYIRCKATRVSDSKLAYSNALFIPAGIPDNMSQVMFNDRRAAVEFSDHRAYADLRSAA